MPLIKLVVTNRKTQDRREYQLTQNTIVFGRAANCDVVLESDSVSRRHLQFVVHSNLVEIEDLGSGNGTLVNQQKIASKERVPLKKGDQIRVEEFDIAFEAESLPTPNTGAPTPPSKSSKFEITDPDILEIKMIKKILGAFDHDKRPGLIVVTTPFQNLRAHVEDGETDLIIGREPKCALAIDHQTVSRKHAKLSQKWGGFVVTDLDSKNGTFVNGEKVSEKTIIDGDEIVFGTIKAVFRNPQEFDIEAISRTMAEERQARDKIGEASALAAADSGKAEATAKSVEPKVEADAAKKEADKKAEEEKAKKEKEKKEKEAQEKRAQEEAAKKEAEAIAAAEDAAKTKAPQAAAKNDKAKSGLSLGEKFMLLFGLALLGLLSAGLYYLLK